MVTAFKFLGKIDICTFVCKKQQQWCSPLHMSVWPGDLQHVQIRGEPNQKFTLPK